jgi:hypothetical protein
LVAVSIRPFSVGGEEDLHLLLKGGGTRGESREEGGGRREEGVGSREDRDREGRRGGISDYCSASLNPPKP